MLINILNKAKRLRSYLLYPLYQLRLQSHAKYLPKLHQQDQFLADQLIQESVAISSLEDLDLPHTDRLIEAAERYLGYMRELIPSVNTEETQSNTNDPAYPHIFTVTDLPEFYDWATHPRLISIAEHYIGLPVKFQGVHLRRDFANRSPVTTELWHRDREDHRLVKIFVYLTDATDEYGPLEYIPKDKISDSISYRIRKATANSAKWRLGITDEEMSHFVPREEWKRCSVPSGSVVFADPVAVFHHGKSRQRERASLFFVYSSAAPLRPDHVSQYSDATYARPGNLH